MTNDFVDDELVFVLFEWNPVGVYIAENTENKSLHLIRR
jgi:hypothetical protein